MEKTELKKAITVVGPAIRTTNENMQSIQDIGALWGQFFSSNMMEKITNADSSGKLYGVYTDFEGDHTKPFVFMIGVPVTGLEKLPEGMRALEIPAGTYTVFSGKGADNLEKAGDAWQKVWKTPLDRNYVCDFEVYSLTDSARDLPVYIGEK